MSSDTAPSGTIRILMVEDTDTDAELIVRRLQRGSLTVEIRIVDTAAALVEGLETLPDIVLSDYRLPTLTGMDALRIVKEHDPSLPFILVSGTIGEEAAIEALQAGVDDYILKDNLKRLLPAVEHQLRRASERRARRLADQALRESEERFRQMAENIREVFWLTDPANKEVLYVSPAYEEIWGRPRRSLLDNPRTWLEGVHPEDRERVSAAIAGNRASARRMEQYRVVRPDGSVRWIRDKAFPVLDADGKVYRLAGVAEDITERKRAMDGLRESERRFRDMLGRVKLLSLMLDREARITYCNDHLLRLTGWSREEILGGKWFEIFFAPERNDHGQVFSDMVADQPWSWHREGEIVTRSGERLLIRWSNTVLRSSTGEVIGTASIGEDITASRRAELQIRRLNRVYAVLSGINTLIVRVSDRRELLARACRIAVEAGQFPKAWVGTLEGPSRELTLAAGEGGDPQYFEALAASLRHSASESSGTVALVLRTRQPVVCNDLENDERVDGRAKERALASGSRSYVMLPLAVGGQVQGIVALHAEAVDFFDDAEMRLLSELADNISFALDHIDKEERVRYLSHYDPLTGLANRASFLERLTRSIGEAAGAPGRRFGVVMMNVDRFKMINDTLGREAGDELLRQIAGRFDRGRTQEPRHARVSADGFGVITVPVASGTDLAARLDRRLQEYFNTPFHIQGTDLRISVKAGAALFPDDGRDADTLFQKAEAALKRAKQSGETYMVYTDEMSALIAETLTLENNLRRALERGELVLHYQPKIDTRTGRMAGVEALMRWQSPERGLVPPGRFIPLLEDTGLILQAGAWALRQAAADYRRWAKLCAQPPRIAVNVSPVQLRKREFVDSIVEAIGPAAGPAAADSGIDLEITESVIMEAVQENVEKLRSVREMGLDISIDDFGTGYSSLGYLAKLPVQALKIDRSFVITMLKERSVMTLVTTIVNLAHSLGLKVIAEGVDEPEQVRVLRQMDCDQMQGYLFSKPVPFQKLTDLLLQSDARLSPGGIQEAAIPGASRR